MLDCCQGLFNGSQGVIYVKRVSAICFVTTEMPHHLEKSNDTHFSASSHLTKTKKIFREILQQGNSSPGIVSCMSHFLFASFQHLSNQYQIEFLRSWWEDLVDLSVFGPIRKDVLECNRAKKKETFDSFDILDTLAILIVLMF